MMFYPLLLLLAIQYPTLLQPIGIGLLMNALVFMPAFYFATAQQLLHRRWIFALPLIFLMSMFASGMVLNTMRALFQIAQKRVVPFERTPKFGITHRAQHWLSNRYQVNVDSLVILEFLLAIFNLWTSWIAFNSGYFLMMMYAFFFAFGLFFFAGFTLFQSLSTRFIRDDLVAELAREMRPEERIWLPEIFYAGGTVTKDLSSADLVADLLERGVRATFLADRAEIVPAVAREARAGDLVLVMGARDPSLTAFARSIFERIVAMRAGA
ncbi:MAG: hypothetical protein HC797_07085 [Anaerolineales bacterium]|nr:hypothetical protein [Anaerolineales bacterium]